MSESILEKLGVEKINCGACYGEWLIDIPKNREALVSVNPATGKKIAGVIKATEKDYEKVLARAEEAAKTWKMMSQPKRGEIVSEIKDELKLCKKELGALVAMEMGKIAAEGEGEVQEMIDICKYADGLSMQPNGIIIPSERDSNFMFEQWHPRGVIGVISAFNFPVAVWSWNAAIAATCGNTIVWKPSSKTPLTAIAVQNICNKVMKRHNLEGIFNLLIGDGKTIGERMINDKRVALISATGSTKVGRHVNIALSKRFGKSLLELGGNNAVIVMNDADLDLALRAIHFGAVGTAGQRCTSTRRLLLQKEIAGTLTQNLISAYKQVTIGDPLNPKTLMGPLIDEQAVSNMMSALKTITEQGGKILYGGNRIKKDGFFVEPTIVKAHKDMTVVQTETFAPILYVFEIGDFDEAIYLHNNVPQGLSSSIFTQNIQTAFKFLSHYGSDCGIANVNTGTSGAEIGGAFGGEKETGGGREAGSDSWKQYMWRQTCNLNWSNDLPLAQGIKFG